MSTACGSDRPPSRSNSRHESKLAESLAVSSSTGSSRSIPRPAASGLIKSVASIASRARIQLRLPLIVLISPLWAAYRYGCASGQDGKVFVENRECTSARADEYLTSDRSG